MVHSRDVPVTTVTSGASECGGLISSLLRSILVHLSELPDTTVHEGAEVGIHQNNGAGECR